jgi:hypothetical protein
MDRERFFWQCEFCDKFHLFYSDALKCEMKCRVVWRCKFCNTPHLLHEDMLECVEQCRAKILLDCCCRTTNYDEYDKQLKAAIQKKEQEDLETIKKRVCKKFDKK